MSGKHLLSVLLYGALAGAGCVTYDEAPPPVQTEAPAQPPTDQQMYETLAPYGDWVETDTYGSVWCPNAGAVGVGFSPYRNGTWVWTANGYYFSAYDSWGWLPYHYGNWVSLDTCGWAWVPGFTWGPAWVDWYYGYPYPLAPVYHGRPWHIAYPPRVTVAHPVIHATVVTPHLDLATGRLYAGTVAAPAGARLVTPPQVARPGFVGFRSQGAMVASAHSSIARGPTTASFGGARTGAWGARPTAPGAVARPAPGGAPRYSAPPAHYSAPVHAAPAHVSSGAVHVGGGHHR